MLQIRKKVPGASYPFNVITVLREGVDRDAEEDVAMSMAMYSRSPRSIEAHIASVNQRGSENFMNKFYCGYGHDSIGDCAEAALYIEGVSMLMAKIIQNNPLYRGQEGSTRFMPFDKANFLVPGENPVGRAYVEKLRAFYMKARPVMVAKFAQENGVDMNAVPEVDPVTKKLTEAGAALAAAQNAVNAKAFDVVRGFLPYGASTNVAVAMTVRTLRDHRRWIEAIDLTEAQEVAAAMLEALRDRYPNSFNQGEEPETTKAWRRKVARISVEHEYAQIELASSEVTCSVYDQRCPEGLEGVLEGGLPPHLGVHLPVLEASFLIDIGSYRDGQRQQSVSKNFPIATTKLGIAPWYLEQLDESLRAEASELLAEAKQAEAAFSNVLEAQYVIPMAYRVNFTMRGNLDKFDYILDLRTKNTVHPTLRAVMRQLARKLNSELPVELRYLDEEDKFDVRRGKQTITEK